MHELTRVELANKIRNRPLRRLIIECLHLNRPSFHVAGRDRIAEANTGDQHFLILSALLAQRLVLEVDGVSVGPRPLEIHALGVAHRV